MNSILDPNVVYEDISADVTEHDIDVVSDLWNMDGRDVYRGSRDPRYTHANVYWLYDESLSRVGLCEHSLKDHAQFHILWLYESEFATFLQEEGWEVATDIWSKIPKHVYERCFSEGFTTPEKLLELCLNGPSRIVTLEMVRSIPTVYSCEGCKQKSLKPICVSNQIRPLDFPQKEKVFFIDLDMVIHIPPTDSRVFTRLLQLDGSSSQEQVLERQAPLHMPPHAAPPPRQTDPAGAGLAQEQASSSPAQSRP